VTAPRPGRLPDAVLAGVPKAGTSALARWLGARSDVYLPPDKEVHFFDERRGNGVGWYREQFGAAPHGSLVLDATPTYALRDDWFADLAATLPEARIVVLLRHPVERLWSAYWYLRSLGLEPRRLERAVDDELAGRDRLPYAHVASGVYPDVLDRVERHYPSSQVLVLLHDDLRSDPARVFDQTCDFLGIDRSRPPDVGGEVNVTGTLRSYHLRHWTLRLHLFRRLPKLAHALDGWNRTTRRPPELPAGLRHRLLDHYAASTSELERRLGRDLAGWRR
jgi:hypothetical protein